MGNCERTEESRGSSLSVPPPSAFPDPEPSGVHSDALSLQSQQSATAVSPAARVVMSTTSLRGFTFLYFLSSKDLSHPKSAPTSVTRPWASSLPGAASLLNGLVTFTVSFIT